MNTKTDGISSGLVAVAWMAADEGGDLEFNTINKFSCGRTEGTPLVRLSDAEAIINDLQTLVIAENQRKQQLEAEVAAKDAEIMEQCRINGMGAERDLALLGQIERQSAALKLASLALSEGVEYVEEPPEKNCSCHLSPPCNDCVDHSAVREFFIDARKALAAIDALKGE